MLFENMTGQPSLSEGVRCPMHFDNMTGQPSLSEGVPCTLQYDWSAIT